MKKQKNKKSSSQPVRHNHVILGQLTKLIPPSIIRSASSEFGLDAQDRTCTVLSHLAAMRFVKLAHALSLNDVCDWLRLKGKAIAAFGITPPARNTLSNANKKRRAKFVEQVFWKTLEHLCRAAPGFRGKHPDKRRRNLGHRFKKAMHAIDSTTMELVAKGRRILKDQIIKLTGANFQDLSGWTLRGVEAWVEVDGKDKLMVFITNGTEGSARSLCDLRRAPILIKQGFQKGLFAKLNSPQSKIRSFERWNR